MTTLLYRGRYSGGDIDVRTSALDDAGEPHVMTYNRDGSPRPLLIRDRPNGGWSLTYADNNQNDLAVYARSAEPPSRRR